MHKEWECGWSRGEVAAQLEAFRSMPPARGLTRRRRGLTRRVDGNTLILLRHGHSDWNAKNSHGWVDVDLNDRAGRGPARRDSC